MGLGVEIQLEKGCPDWLGREASRTTFGKSKLFH